MIDLVLIPLAVLALVSIGAACLMHPSKEAESGRRAEKVRKAS
jgi:hypothetical protein